MDRFIDYIEDNYEDAELYNYFSHLFQSDPRLMRNVAEPADAIWRWQKDPNAPHRPDIDPRRLHDIVNRAKQDARSKWAFQAQSQSQDKPEPFKFAQPKTVKQPEPEVQDGDIQVDEPQDYYDRFITGMDKDQNDPHASRRITKAQREEIMNLAKRGMNAAEIAFHVDVPVWVIDGLLKRTKVGGTTDPSLSISNMQRASDEEEMMNRRAKWDKPTIPSMDQEKDYERRINTADQARRDAETRHKQWPMPRHVFNTQEPHGQPDDGGKSWDRMMNRSIGRNQSRSFMPSPEQVKQIKAMHAQGASSKGIAFDLQIPHRVVKTIIQSSNN
jgi:hypothetical protein